MTDLAESNEGLLREAVTSERGREPGAPDRSEDQGSKGIEEGEAEDKSWVSPEDKAENKEKPPKESGGSKRGEERKKTGKDKKVKKDKKKSRRGTRVEADEKEKPVKPSSSGATPSKEETGEEDPSGREAAEDEEERARELQTALDRDVERHPRAYHLEPLPVRARGSLGDELARKASVPSSDRPAEPAHPPLHRDGDRSERREARRSRSRRRGTKGAKHHQRGKERREFWKAQRAFSRK